MSDEADNVLRFPIERRRLEASEAIFYTELSVETDTGTNVCPTWGHIWAMGDATCVCGGKTHEPEGPDVLKTFDPSA